MPSGQRRIAGLLCTRGLSNISYRLEPGRPTQNTYVESFSIALSEMAERPAFALSVFGAPFTITANPLLVPIVWLAFHGLHASAAKAS